MAPILIRQFSKLQAPPLVQQARSGIPHALQQKPISTPLVVGAWERALQAHPSPQFVQHILTGIREGFRIGLDNPPPCASSARNAPSAKENSAVIDAYLSEQIAKGYIAGPFSPGACSAVVTSSMAVIPKKTPGKWRVIVDLSRPEGRSVNDHLRRESTHIAYSSVDDAAHLMHFLGRGALMAKLDIREAYRIVPIHPCDRRFLGVTWRDNVYVDCQLPFGLASAPAIFSAIGEALEWILRQRGVRGIIHYIDDFLLLGSPASPECLQALHTTLSTCQELGIPIAEEKTEGPSTTMTFLGIYLDSQAMCTALPADKLLHLRSMIDALQQAKTVRDVHQLDSLVGHLVHASTVCPLGKAFLNNLFAVKATLQPNQIRRLNLAARADLAWWKTFLAEWSGTSVQQLLLLRHPDHLLFCDASGSWGCAAWAFPHWCQVPWEAQDIQLPIAVKELFPVVVATGLWGQFWSGCLVLCHSDNSAVVAQVNSLHARHPTAAFLLQCLALFQALYDCRIRAVHVPGHSNGCADLLSRGGTPSSQSSYPGFSTYPSQVPPPLLRLLRSQPPQGTLHLWRDLFSSFWRTVSPPQPEVFTHRHGVGISPSHPTSPSPCSPCPRKR